MEVYVKTDANNRIIDINSTAWLVDFAGWTKIDEGEGDRYYHAQMHYFPLPITDEYGVYRYKLVDGMPEERTAEEMEADRPIQEPEETIEEKIQTLKEMVQILTDCLLEMSEIVYA